MPFFKILRKNKAFNWTKESEVAFKQLKGFLGSPPLLIVGEELIIYLSILPTAISAMFILEKDTFQKPVYFVSKVFIGAETRYLKIEKLAYALLITIRKLLHYFQARPIAVLID